MKKMLSIVVTLICVSAYLVLENSDGVAAADSGSCGTDLKYSFDSSTGTLTISGSGAMYDYKYDDAYRHAPWYNYGASITSVIVGDSATSIGSYAFYGCTSIETLVISDTVTSLGEGSFLSTGTSLKNLTIPVSLNLNRQFSGTENIEKITFTVGTGQWCYYSDYLSTPWYLSRAVLNEVTISEGVLSIGDNAFNGCTSLPSITIPDSVKSIGKSAFSGCTSLASLSISTSIASLEESTFAGCTSLTSLKIPDSVISIGSGTFSGCSGLTSITISDTVESIGKSAFSGCTSLTSLTIGNFVTSIEENTFARCSALTSLTIGNSVASIGQNAFKDCTSLTFLKLANPTM